MAGPIMKAIVCAVALLLSSVVHAAPPSSLLLEAELVKARFLHLNEDPADPLTVYPSTWRVELRDVRVVQGDPVRIPASMTVELLANHRPTRIPGPIYLVVSAEEPAKVLYWADVALVACVPAELVDPRYIDGYVRSPWAQDDRKCTELRGYRSPPGADDERAW